MMLKNKARNIRFILTLCSFWFLTQWSLQAQITSHTVNLKWKEVGKVEVSENHVIHTISFEGSNTQVAEFGWLPTFIQRFPLPPHAEEALVQIVHAHYSPVAPLVMGNLEDVEKITSEIPIIKQIETARGKKYVIVQIMPLRKNILSGSYERLNSFTLQIEPVKNKMGATLKAGRTYAEHSVFATGTWYKLAVNNSGVFKISYNELKNFGIDMTNLNPKNIRIFGNGGGMLAESNAVGRYDDLVENPIMVSGEDDGKFDEGDFILFYGQSPDAWKFNEGTQLFQHFKNFYSDFNYYFLTTDNGAGKRIATQPSSSQQATDIITKFNDYAFYEKDEVNLIKSGREWYDKSIFDITRERSYDFSFPNMDNTYPGTLKVDVAARSTSGSTSFAVSANSAEVMNISVGATSSDWLAEYGKKATKSSSFAASGDAVTVGLTFNKYYNEAIGYLNYIEINVVRQLKMAGSQMGFRSILSKGKNKVSQYDLNGNGQNLTIWDVTDLSSIANMGILKEGANYVFKQSKNDSLIHHFIAFDGSEYKSISSYTRIENQDLHGTGTVDYIIVTAPEFLQQATELSQFHQEKNGFTVLVTTPEKIYNEFSSGAQDITAIRDFMKMLYDRGGADHAPKHLLLLGDASYDYKSRIQSNTNYVPTFESPESLDPVDSYVTDDYFVILDDNEGQNASGALDMGVGRFPVQTADEAAAMVRKVKYYCMNSDTVKNDWRNVISFVAEDWDNNLHLSQTEESVSIIETSHKEYNIDKIYLDAYQAVPTPGGLRNPTVNEAINKRLAKGALLMNYTGHGGELGWAHERVLEIPDIKSWTNINNMPAFVTATCEFSRFDDPGFVSAGEWVFLNQNGGGIALFTTTRPTFAGSNLALTSNFYNNAFEKIDGKFPKMGDLIMEAKNATGGSANSRKFILLGDPALQLAYPEYEVVTTAINNKSSITGVDTLRALAEVTIAGEVRDDGGSVLTNFNGTVFPTVYDKASEIQTLGNTGGSITTFEFRKNIIYRGKVIVTNGHFQFTFMVPKDIAYQYGPGKISYYARSGETDASGYDMSLVVGGYNNGALMDDVGPEIDLFMNDMSFKDGGITNQNPHLVAVIQDTSGINTVGNGIGHDITAILDENTQDAKILNDYYVSDENTFRSGVIKYPYYSLSEGKHTITVKAWDVYNNSSEASISFNVIPASDFVLQNLINYPNPVYDQTTFAFEYNQTGSYMDVEIKIYSLMGDLVKTIQQEVYTDGFRSATIHWDGSGDGGARLYSGTYAYTVKLSFPDGVTLRQSSKLVVIH